MEELKIFEDIMSQWEGFEMKEVQFEK